MKKLLGLILFIIISHTAQSQMKLGLVSSYAASIGRAETTILPNDDGSKAMEIAFLEHRNLASFGLAVSSDFGNLYFNAEAHYRRNAFTLRIKNFQQIDAPMSYVEETSSVVHIPVIGGLKFKNMRIGVGPIFNFQMNRSSGLMENYNIQERKRRLQTGFLGSVGIDLTKKIRLSLRYEHSFSKVGDDYDYRTKRLPINSKLDYLSATIGYYF